MRLSHVPETAYAVETNFATFCIMMNPRHTEGCLRILERRGVGEGDNMGDVRDEVSGDGGEELKNKKYLLIRLNYGLK